MEAVRPASMAPGLGADGDFTEADLAAADQLVQLSVSGGAEAASPTSSARSVNNTEAADKLVQLGVGKGPNTGAAARKEDDQDDGVVDRRARKRYRRVAELYRATSPAKRGASAGKGRREDGDRRDRHRRQIDRPTTWVFV